MNAHRRQPSRPAAFTLTELIAVMTIIVILLAVSIPAFRSTLASSEASNVETQLRLAMLSGRDAALRSDTGADTAVVFTYQPGGRTTILICEYVGTFRDRSQTPGTDRDVFVPTPAFEPVQLAAGWVVHGLVPAGVLVSTPQRNLQWFEDLPGRALDEDQRNWVFPETDFYDALVSDDGGDRQTFMIRFNGGTGSVALGDSREALIVSPRPTAAGRTNDPFGDHRVDATADMISTVRRALNRDDYGNGQSPGQLTVLFGDQSGDTILARTVEQIALYKLSDLASDLGLKLNRDTGVFYAASDEPELDPRRGSDIFYDRVRWWIEGNTSAARDGRDDNRWIVNDENDRPVARIYTIQRYSGQLQPVPLLDLEGGIR